LRFTGLGSREIADRTQLPFRLVHQVLEEVRSRVVDLGGCEETIA
jgi:hypothetical protein